MPACRTPATANATKVYYHEQTLCGELPADAAFKRMRFVSGSPSVSADTLLSAELDGTPEITGVRLGSRTPSVDNSVELYYGAHDDLLAGAMQSDWVAGTPTASVGIVVDAATKTWVIAGVDLTSAISVGDIVKAVSLTGYNTTPLQVTEIAFSTDTTITFAAARESNSTYNITGITDETGTSVININDTLIIGVTRKRFALLFEYGDITGAPKYELMMDCEVTGFTFNFAVNANVTGNLNFIGVSNATDFTVPGGWTFADSAFTGESFTGIDGCVIKNNTPVLGATSADLALDRGASAAFELCSQNPAHISYDKANNTVGLSAFVYDLQDDIDFQNEVVDSCSVVARLDGKALAFSYPNLKITSADKDISTGDITRTTSRQAFKPGTATSSLIIRRVE